MVTKSRRRHSNEMIQIQRLSRDKAKIVHIEHRTMKATKAVWASRPFICDVCTQVKRVYRQC